MSDRSDQETTPTPANVGGQAVLEGVMMRAPGSLAIVCRRRNGSLVVRERSIPVITEGPKTWPFMRGMLTLFSSLRLGSQSLKWSAQVLEHDLDEEDRRLAAAKERRESGAAKKSAKGAGAAAPPSIFTWIALAIARVATLTGEETPHDDEVGADEPSESDAASPKKASWPPKPDATVTGTFQVTPKPEGSKLAALLPIAFAIFLFIALPQAVAEGMNSLFKLKLEVTSPGYQVITGVAKLCIIVSYLGLIRLMPDVRRVFQYHGAEHKAISTYEAKRDLVVPQARAMTALHARCGTTFIIMVAFVSVVLFSVVGAFLPPIPGGRAVQSLGFFLMKLPLFPVIAGITFELQRFFARYCSTGPLRVLLWPGFLVQKITTAEPDDDQLEIALASLRAALAHAKVTLPEDHPDRTFASYKTLLGDPSFSVDDALARA
jgi:uncharacterized protein YqhQ